MNVSLPEAIASQIRDWGIRHVFGIPGSGSSLVLVDGLERAGVHFHTVQHEGAAAVMAGTLGRLTGVAGAAISIKGPGLANMAAGMALCHLESFPMVAIAEGVAPGTPAFRAHKRMDHEVMVGACSKGYFMPQGNDDFTRAAALAEHESPAPVLLELLDQPCGEGADKSCQADLPSVNDDVSLIPPVVETSRRPIVVCGTLAMRLDIADDLNNLSVPVFSTAAAKGVVNESLPHAGGVFTGVGLEKTPEAQLFKDADLIIAIGLRAREMLGVSAFGAEVVAIDAVADAGDEAWNFGALLPPQMARDVLGRLNGLSWGQEEIASLRKSLVQVMMAANFLPAHVFSMLDRHFGEQTRTILDTGNFCTVGEHLCMARNPNDVLLSGQGRYMGAGIGMAIASAIHDPDRTTVLAVGDGGIGPQFAELRLAVSQKLPLLVVLLSDGGFSSIRGRALKDGLTLKPLTPPNASWLGMMEGMGMAVYDCADEASFLQALSQWSPQDGPAYVEARFVAQDYDRMLDGVR